MIEDELAEYDEEWAEIDATIEEKEFEPLPDGKYQAEVMEARVEHSKRSGRLQFTLVFQILAPSKHAGRVTTKCTGLENTDQRGWVKQDLLRLLGPGAMPQKLSDLPLLCPLIVGMKVNIALVSKEKDGTVYQNVYINKVLSTSKNEVDVPDFVDAAEYDKDLPF
jgi:hypothetical protein